MAMLVYQLVCMRPKLKVIMAIITIQPQDPHGALFWGVQLLLASGFSEPSKPNMIKMTQLPILSQILIILQSVL